MKPSNKELQKVYENKLVIAQDRYNEAFNLYTVLDRKNKDFRNKMLIKGCKHTMTDARLFIKYCEKQIKKFSN